MKEEPRSSIDAIIEVYMKGVDVTLIKKNLRLTPDQRVRRLVSLQGLAQEAHRAGRRLRDSSG